MPYTTNSFLNTCDLGPCPHCGECDMHEDHVQAELVCKGCAVVRLAHMFTTGFGDADLYAPLPTKEDAVLSIVRKRLNLDMLEEHMKIVARTAEEVKQLTKIRSWADAIFVALTWCTRKGQINAISKPTMFSALNISQLDEPRLNTEYGRFSEKRAAHLAPGTASATATPSSPPTAATSLCYVTSATSLTWPP
eukprot:gene2291-8579_t